MEGYQCKEILAIIHQRDARDGTSKTCSRLYIKDMLVIVHQRHAHDCTSNEKPWPISLF